MRMIKRIMPVLMLALIMTACTAAMAFAETYDYDGTCTYSGGRMIEGFDSAEIASRVSDLQPGDDVTFTVGYENDDEDSTDWYMENSIVQTLEKTDKSRKNQYVSGNDAAENGGYTYELILIDSNGTRKQLFSNSRVGGDEGSVADLDSGKNLEGLEPATNALDDWFYIDTLDKGESGTVILHVAFDGETEVNDYMDTDGELNVRFAVEKVSEGKTPTGKTVKTGDQSNLIMWAAIGVIAGLLMLILAFLSRKRDEKQADSKGGRA